jgi:general secretion pathway protein K
MTAQRKTDSGVILINVLVTLTLCAAVVLAMLQLSDAAITRSQRFSAAGQAHLLLDGAELSAISALQRDLQAGVSADHLAEDWARIGQDEIAIDGGRFSLLIEDAQAKFNLNNLVGQGPDNALMLQRLLTALDLPEITGRRILARLVAGPALQSLSDLESAGLGPDELRVLEALVTVLPGPTTININTMPAPMFAIVAGNPVQGRLLQGIRQRNGQLTADDLLRAGLVLTGQTGLTSRYFSVTTRVTVGDVTLARASLISRLAGHGSAPVRVIARRSLQ